MSIWFVISLIAKRNDVVDMAWGPGFVVIALAMMLQYNNYSGKAGLLFLLVVLWATRLSIHIWPRLKHKTEDFRYAQWRRDWGKFVYVRSFLQVFLLQGLLMVVIASGIIMNAVSGSSFAGFNWLGLLVWMAGFGFETVGDYQLSSFLKHPANRSKIMTKGLWRYSRHPNYFGEVTQWWGILLIVLPSAYWYLALISPVAITFLILFVTGIPLLEKKFMKKPGYKEYARRTSSFIPLPPKRLALV